MHNIIDLVYISAKNTNEILTLENQLSLNKDEYFIGPNAKIGSLGLINLLVSVEQEVSSFVGSCPDLVNDISDLNSGVFTLGDLSVFIEKQIKKSQ
jgi:hypothetical protein